MAVRNDSALARFDSDAALAAARDVADGAVHICVEYDVDGFTTLYVDEQTLALYGSEERAREHFEEVHSYVHVDFTERDLFEDVLFAAGTVRSFVTYMEHTTAVRVMTDEAGLFLALDPGAPVTPIVDAVEDAL